MGEELGIGFRDGGLGVGGGFKIGLGRGITDDNKGHKDTVHEVDSCGPKI